MAGSGPGFLRNVLSNVVQTEPRAYRQRTPRARPDVLRYEDLESFMRVVVGGCLEDAYRTVRAGSRPTPLRREPFFSCAATSPALGLLGALILVGAVLLFAVRGRNGRLRGRRVSLQL